LRARQGKLKAIKFGRNWVTKKEWVEEYLAKVEEYNNNFKAKKEKRTLTVRKVKKEIFPPKNLPIGAPELVPVRPLEYQISEFFKTPIFKNASIVALILFLAIAGIIWKKDSLLGGGELAWQGISETTQKSFSRVYNDMSGALFLAGQKISEDEVYSAAVYDTADIFGDYFEWIVQSPAGRMVKKSLKFVWQNGKQGYIVVQEGYIKADRFLQQKYIILGQAILNGWDNFVNNIRNAYFAFINGLEEFVQKFASVFSRTKQFVLNWFKPSKIVSEEELAPEPVKEGLLVIPSTEKDTEMKKKIKESFSDEVKVEPVDKTSGIITPVFRTGEGDRYLYILVPITHNDD